MNYNINVFITPKSKEEYIRCACCNKRVQKRNIKQHQQSKYCKKVRSILDKLSPLEVGILKGTDAPYSY